MKRLISFCLFTLCTQTIVAQRTPENWCAKNQYAVLRFYKGDSILVNCDTVFLVNTATYKLYADVFSNFNAKNSDVKRLATLFDQSKALYENRIREQNEEYSALKKQFDEMVAQSRNVVQQTSEKLVTVDNSLIRIDKNVAHAQANIEEAKNLIRQEIRLGNRQRLKWGIGGVVVGVGIASIVYAIVD